MALIQNQSDFEHMGATSVLANQPADDRLVILQDVVDNKVVTVGARYRAGRWIGESGQMDITASLTEAAIWTETYLWRDSAGPTDDRVPLHPK